jgi:hypothetical protein
MSENSVTTCRPSADSPHCGQSPGNAFPRNTASYGRKSHFDASAFLTSRLYDLICTSYYGQAKHNAIAIILCRSGYYAYHLSLTFKTPVCYTRGMFMRLWFPEYTAAVSRTALSDCCCLLPVIHLRLQKRQAELWATRV